MKSELEKKKKKLEVIRKKFQEAYKASTHQESFRSWIQNGNWGIPLSAEELIREGVLPDDAQRRVLQKQKNDIVLKNYFFASLFDKAPFSTEFMCEAHCCLFHQVMYFSGIYRTDDVYLHNTAIKIPPAYIVARKMHEMEEEYNNSPKNVLDILKLNYDIVTTQPFIDGNKTIARTMMNYELLRRGYTPILFSSKKDKESYLLSLENSFAGESLTPFYQFMIDKMFSTAQIAFQVLDGQTPTAMPETEQAPKVITSHEIPVVSTSTEKENQKN